MKTKLDRKRWRMIRRINLTQIMEKVKAENNWSDDEANKHLANYRKFLWLLGMRISPTPIPNKEIERFWHAHILDTQKYAHDCNKVFNRIIHHKPTYRTKKTSAKRVRSTIKLFKEHFGTDLEFWGDQGYADPCNLDD